MAINRKTRRRLPDCLRFYIQRLGNPNSSMQRSSGKALPSKSAGGIKIAYNCDFCLYMLN